MKRAIIFISLLLISGVVFAQTGSQANQKLTGMCRALPDRILLRWAPGNAPAWYEGNRTGYTVDRTTVARWNESPGNTWERLAEPIPAPSGSWKKWVETNDLAGVAWQAIYGEDFEVGIQGGKNSSLVNKISQFEQRFSFGLMACDRNFKVACWAGLGYVDSTANKDERYIYRIMRRSAETAERGDTVFIVASVQDYGPLPVILKPFARFTDRSVMIAWEAQLYRSVYSAFVVERADETGDFHPLGKAPTADLNGQENEGAFAMMVTDSIPNGKLFRYRVRGVSYFGETGPPSEEVSGQAAESNQVLPYFSGFTLLSGGKVKLKWEFPLANNRLIDRFEIEQADNEEGLYQTFLTVKDVNQREAEVLPPLPVNYFLINAIGKDGSVSRSMPFLVQKPDSIPPAPPTRLVAKIDSLGTVTLSWNKNEEKDLWGYKISRGNLKNEEFSLLTPTPVPDAFFTDSVSLGLLNAEVYYQVVAVDKVNNTSKPSEAVEVAKPDTIPPTAPLFTNFEIRNNCIYLSWANSSSDDLKTTILTRRKLPDGKPEILASWAGAFTKAFADSLIEGSAEYEYGLDASDKSGNTTSAIRSVKIEVPVLVRQNILYNLTGKSDEQRQAIAIKWKEKASDIEYIEIYRGKGQNPPSFYKCLPGQTGEFTDSHVELLQNYTYQLKAVCKNGDFSNTTGITIKN